MATRPPRRECRPGCSRTSRPEAARAHGEAGQDELSRGPGGDHGRLLDDILSQPASLETLPSRPWGAERKWERLAGLLQLRRAPAIDPRLVRLGQHDGGPLPPLRRPGQQQRDLAAVPLPLPTSGRQVALAAGSGELLTHLDSAIAKIAHKGFQHRRLLEPRVAPRWTHGEVGRAHDPLQCGDITCFQGLPEHVGECGGRRGRATAHGWRGPAPRRPVSYHPRAC
jgi:hypothetical protein